MRELMFKMFAISILLAVAISAMIAFMGHGYAYVSEAQLEDHMVTKAVDCGADPELALWMLDEERLCGIPLELRGYTLAKACMESRFNPLAKGDCKEDGNCRALGLLQMWPWVTKSKWNPLTPIDRRDPRAVTRFYLEFATLQMIPTTRWKGGPVIESKLKRYCPVRERHPINKWITAFVRINRSPKDKYGYHRCNEKPLGLRWYKKWRKELKDASG